MPFRPEPGASGVFRFAAMVVLMLPHDPDKPELHLVTDASLEPLDLIGRIELATRHGIDIVQLRLPGTSARHIYEVAVALQASLANTRTRLIVNDRIDVAMAVNAAGVQLGSRSLPIHVARCIWPSHAAIGASVHSAEEAQQAEQRGAHYVTFGHVYETGSHSTDPAHGPDQLANVVQSVRIPVIAIGGITSERVADVLATGARGIAVMSAIMRADDAAAATEALRSALDAMNERTCQ